jgi:fucose 4-O-acetylase-like acetyltransferase
MLAAVSGILMLWALCQWLLSTSSSLVTRLSAALDYIGNHTLRILTWHFLCFKAVTLLIILFYGLPIEQLAALPILEEQAAQGWWLLYTLAGVCVVFL